MKIEKDTSEQLKAIGFSLNVPIGPFVADKEGFNGIGYNVVLLFNERHVFRTNFTM